MTKWLLMTGLVLAGCATAKATQAKAPEAEPAAAEGALTRVKSALDRLPACAPGAEVGTLSPRASTCTKKLCRAACCNQCAWTATFDTTSGARPADPARVEAVLGLPQSALDCEIAAWGQALAGQSIALDAAPCVVR